MRKIPIIIIILILSGNILLAQDDEWFIEKPILKFEFHGLQSISEAELKPILKGYIGQKFTYDLFFEIQGRLYALEYFNSIEAEALAGDQEKNNVIIKLSFQEKPMVNLISFEGRNKLSEDEVLDKILLKVGDIFSNAKLRADEEAIKAFYKEKGYADITVEGRTELNEEENTVNVIFSLTEGQKATVSKILFEGNGFASEGTLKNEILSKESWLFIPSVFMESNIEADILAIELYYANNGYIDAKVQKVDREYEVDESGENKFLTLTYYIEEGDQYTYGGVTFSGNEIFSDQRLLSLVKQEPGKIFSRKKFETDFQNVVSLYYNNGYISANIGRSEERDENNKVVSYEIQIQEGGLSHIENIIIRGNDKTKDHVINRELPFEEGDIFNTAKIRTGIINLHRLGYFNTNMPIDTPQGSAPGLVDIVITVEEKSTAQFQGNLSFSSGEFPIAVRAGINDINFMGSGQTIGADLMLSYTEQSLSFNFLEQWLFNERIRAGVNLSFSHKYILDVLQDILPPVFDNDDYIAGKAVPDPYDGHYVFLTDREYPEDSGNMYNAGDPFPDESTPEMISKYVLVTDYEYAKYISEFIPEEYRMEYHTIDTTIGGRTGYSFHTPAGWIATDTGVSSTLTYLFYDDLNYRPYDMLLREDLQQFRFVNGWWIKLALDSTNSLYNPTEGYLLSPKITFIGDFLGGDRHFIKTSFKAEYYLTLLNIPVTDEWNFKTIFGLHSEIYFLLDPLFRDIVYLPDNMYYIDGMIIGRGWHPLFRGRVLWDNKAEIRIPILEDILWWAFFFDAAALWPTIDYFSQMEADDYYFTFGGGLRFTIPQFPIRIYLGKRFKFDNAGDIIWPKGNIEVNPDFDFDLIFSFGGPEIF